MTKEKVLETIFQTKVVAVIRMADSGKLLKVVEAVQAGGVKAIEITMTVPDAIEVIRAMARNKPAGVVIGAGSVLDPETARAAILAGAEFVVSPVTNLDTIRLCIRYGVPVMPGALTPTEIVTAWQAGADIVKIFPATSVGPKYFKDIHGPLPRSGSCPPEGSVWRIRPISSKTAPAASASVRLCLTPRPLPPVIGTRSPKTRAN